MLRFRTLQRTNSRESGSAVVEFVFLGLLLLVPVVYFVLALSQLQAGSFAAVGAADQAAKVYVSEESVPDAAAGAQQAALLVLDDFGFDAAAAEVQIRCLSECLAPGSGVTVEVRLDVGLPLMPSGSGANGSAIVVDASATQLVERYR